MAAAMHRARVFARSAADKAALQFLYLSSFGCNPDFDVHLSSWILISIRYHHMGTNSHMEPQSFHLHVHARAAGPMVRRLVGGRISTPGPCASIRPAARWPSFSLACTRPLPPSRHRALRACSY